MSIVLDALDRVQQRECLQSNNYDEIKKEKSAFFRKEFKRWMLYFLFDSIIFLTSFYLVDQYVSQKKDVVTDDPATTVQSVQQPVSVQEPTLTTEQPEPVKDPSMQPKVDIVKHEENPSIKLYEQVVSLFSRNQRSEAFQLLSSEQKNSEIYLAVVKKIAILFFQTDRNNLVVDLLTPALSQYPNDVEIREYLGLANFSQGNYIKTIAFLLANQPPLEQHTSYYALLAASYLKISHLQEAVELYLALTKIEPNNPNLFLGLAIAYHAQDKRVLAENYYRTALALSPINWPSRGFVIDELAKIGAQIS